MLSILATSMINANLFAYCLNNPVMYVDPSGYFAFIPILIGIAIGSVVGAAVGYGIAKYFNVPKSKTWKYVLGGALIGAAIGGCIGYVVGASVGSGAVLWSGKEMSKAAIEFARQNGLKKLESTVRGKLLTLLGKILPWSIMQPLWEAASVRFILSYAGKQTYVNVFITAENYKKISTVFKSVEMQVVAELGLKIIWHFFD